MSHSPANPGGGPPQKTRTTRRTATLAGAATLLILGGGIAAGLTGLLSAGTDGGAGSSSADSERVTDATDHTPAPENPSPATSGSAGTSGPGAPETVQPQPVQGTKAPAADRLPADVLLPEPARDAVLSYIDTAAAMAVEAPPTEAEEPSTPDYSGIAAGAALGELSAQFEEFQDNKWTVQGHSELEIRGVEEVTMDDTTVRRVSLCIDSSALQLTDQGGLILLPVEPPGTRTALNYYDLEERDGSWLVVSHSFPDDPSC